MSRMKESLHPKILQILILVGVVRGDFFGLDSRFGREIFNIRDPKACPLCVGVIYHSYRRRGPCPRPG